MDPFLKGVLQGSIPVVVLVGGTHHIVKKLRETKPVLYWGSIILSAGLAFAIVQGKIPAPFMKAETFGAEMQITDIDWDTDSEDVGLPSTVMVPSDLEEDEIADYLSDNYGWLVNGFVMNAEEDDLYYCSKCDEGSSSINPTDEGQFCDSCLPSSATLHDEMERITMDAETFEASGTKKPKLTPKQKQALDMMKYSYGANNNEYAYVEVDNRGWKPHRTRQVQALLNKGLIEIDRAENKNFWGYIENEAYIVKLTPLAWEYKYEDPFGKYTPGSMYQQDGDKMV